MATVEQPVRIAPGSSRDIDSVMRVMDAAFGDRFGEAWTRSQLAGILPMAGVSLILAREPDDGDAIGFSLFRTVAELGGCSSTIFSIAYVMMEFLASISRSVREIRR